MPESPARRLIAVYENEDHAHRVASVLVDAGLNPNQVREEDPADHVASVKGEMRSEMIHTVAGPGNVGPWTPEMTKGMLLGAVIGGAIGFVGGLPFAAFDMGLPVWLRIAIVTVVGISVGSTFGFVIGGGFAARRSDEPLAAESGAVIALPMTEHAVAALLRTDAIRIDLVEADGTPVRVIAERPPEPMHTVRDIGRHMANESRED
jgi:hypothetical protein